MVRKVRYALSFEVILRLQVVEVGQTKSFVDLIHRHPLPDKIFQDAGRCFDLATVLFTSFFVDVYPIKLGKIFPCLQSLSRRESVG